ncbi:hypothetical protein GOP47_0025481 [Adiantum capillus-veneris]|uniref:Ran-specific GTPase-activating protein n=1 Tax=Adiantum capillus-veneris TaxID=13818 RepID=A0A9D4U0T4_ADICA|nr:hypothetical protein GOP47_0025481 [Adiantum capillus-veneris]
MAGDNEKEAATQASAEDADDSRPSAEEEDTGGEVAPIVKLDAVAVSTGEENEDALIDLLEYALAMSYQMPMLPGPSSYPHKPSLPFELFDIAYSKAKLYRFDKEGNQWKERGVGQVKLLKHKDTKKVRLVMRQSKTLKICANHTVVPSISLQEHQGSDKTWVWHASDYADGELKDELFCIRLGSVENAQAFKKAFEDAQKAKESSGGDKEAEEVGGLLENLKVADKAGGEEEKEESKLDSKEESVSSEGK